MNFFGALLRVLEVGVAPNAMDRTFKHKNTFDGERSISDGPLHQI
jgi:hypothetical protein